MSKIRQALQVMLTDADNADEILEKLEARELKFKSMLIAKKAYKAEVKKKKRHDNHYKTNSNRNI